MQKIDETVKRETVNVAVWVLILSVLMQGVFLALSRWSVSVLLGNLFGASGAVLNFFLMGLSIQKSLTKEPNDAKGFMKLSHSMRTLLLFIIAVIGYFVPFFNVIAVIVPFLFPSVAVMIRSASNRSKGGDHGE